MKFLFSLLLGISICFSTIISASADRIALPEQLISIESGAFSGLQVEIVEFPAAIQYIADDAFVGANFIGTGETNTYAHRWCREHGFQYIEISSPVENFKWEAINSDEARILKYIGQENRISIPAKIGDYAVVEIADQAFENCTEVVSVGIPEGIVSIGGAAFKNCISLSDIRLPSTLKEIRNCAFQFCTSLVNAVLPDSVCGLGEHAFDGCVNLESFHYPLSLDHVVSLYDNDHLYDGAIFKDCKKLTSITIPEGITSIPTYLFRNSNYLISVILPSTLEIIQSDAFAMCSSLSTITFPNGLKEIHKAAFRSCASLNNLTFPDGLEIIRADAFSGCTTLTTANLPDSVRGLGEHAFDGCVNLESFHYPLSLDHVVSLYDNDHLYDGAIFKDCKKLTSITIPEGITSIPEFLFRDSNFLISVNLPSTLKTIQNEAFALCTSMPSITFPSGLKEIHNAVFRSCTSLNNLVFPDGLEIIRADAFSGCTALTAANLPDSVRGLGEHAFDGCVNLESFHYPLSLDHVISLHNNGYLYDGAIFKNCKKLTSVTIPEGITAIPDIMFKDCNNLQTIVLPSTLERIGGGGFFGGGAFSNCISLEKIYLSNHVTSIADSAFENCPNLTIFCEWGSTALRHAIDHSIPYYYLSLTGASLPKGTLYKGNYFNLYGYIRSSDVISSITATIYNSDKTKIVQTYSVAPDTKTYNLSGSVNTNMHFAKLPLGSYYYTLTSTAGIETEILQSSYFTVVPPPLSIRIQSKVEPKGFYASAADLKLSGTVVSNYPITSLKFTITDIETGDTMRQYTATPTGNSYVLENVRNQLAFSTLSDGKYTLKIMAVSNGETRKLCETDFHLLNDAGVITEKTYSLLTDFAADSANRNIFTTQFGMAVIENMEWIDGFLILYDDLLHSGSLLTTTLKNNFLQNGKRDDMVDLYKQELVSLIDSEAYGNMDQIPNRAELASQMLSQLKSVGKISKSLAVSEETIGLIDALNHTLDRLNLFTESFDDLITAYETLVSICLNTENGIRILDYLAESHDAARQEELEIAIYELKQEYISDSSAVLYEVGEIVFEAELEALEDVVKLLLKVLKEKESSGQFDLYQVVSKTVFNYMGLGDVTDTYKLFFARYDMLLVANESYIKAFNKVHNGDNSAAALNNLSTAIYITRNAWIRHCDAICNIDSAAYTIGNDALDYQYSNRFRALYDLIPDSFKSSQGAE